MSFKKKFSIIVVSILAILLSGGCYSESYRKKIFVRNNDLLIGNNLPLSLQEKAVDIVNVSDGVRRFIYVTPYNNRDCRYFIDLNLKDWIVSDWGYINGKNDCLIQRPKGFIP